MELLGKYVFIAEGARGSLAKDDHGKIWPARGLLPAEVRHRAEGALGGSTGEPQARTGNPHDGLAAWRENRRGQLHVPPRGQSGLDRLRRASQLPEPLSRSLSGISAVQAPSADRAGARAAGRRIAYGARAITEGGLQSVPKLAFPGRRADRLLGGVRECSAHQGHAQRHEVRHAGGGMCVRCDPRRACRR